MADENIQDSPDQEANTFWDSYGEEQDREDRARRKAALKNAFKKGGRGFLVIGVVAAGLFTYMIMSAPEETTENSTNNASVVNRTNQGNVRETELSEDSPIARQQRETREQQAENARTQGQTYIEQVTLQNQERAEESAAEESVDTKRDTGDLALDTLQSQSQRVSTGNPTPVTPPGQTNQNRRASQSQPEGWTLKDEIEEAKSLGEQAKEDLRKVAESQANYGTYTSYSSASRDTSNSGSSDSNGASNDEIPFVTGGYGEDLAFSQNPSGESPSTFKIPADTRLFGVATTAHNSDIGGPMSFESVTPPLDGAVFLAEEVPVQGEAVVPQITQMIYRGESYDVRALIVNAETFQPGIASDYDNHYLSRWVPYLLGTFGGAYAETLRNSTTTTSPEGATVNESSDIPDAADQVKFTVGTGLGRMVPVLQEQINRPVTVEVYNGEQVGIWILSEVEVKR
ncbi:DotG/IcmE/VirB10 family protein [Marinobacter sp.]|uniref:DotG/IcmE/VirB10 family protein n=1 Tax=Marinobacter sp. TaxID=50741 RepID=UPI0035683F8C